MLSVVVKRQLMSKLNRTLLPKGYYVFLQETSGHEGSVREFHKRQVLSGEDAAAAERVATDGGDSSAPILDVDGAAAVLGLPVIFPPSRRRQRRRRRRQGGSWCGMCIDIRLTRRLLMVIVRKTMVDDIPIRSSLPESNL